MSFDQISLREPWRAFVESSREHWKELVGGSVVALVIGVLATIGFNVPPLIAAALAFGLAVVMACWFAFRDQYGKVIALEERLRSKLDVVYEEDGQCNLSASPTNHAHFRVRLTLGGTEIARHLIATVKAVRKDGREMELRENVRLRFHNAKHGADELEVMNPGTEELLDIFRLDNGLSLANARVYNSFNCYICNDPGHTYEIDISIGSSVPRKDFTLVCQWTGNFNTTKPYIKQPSSAPKKAISQPLLGNSSV